MQAAMVANSKSIQSNNLWQCPVCKCSLFLQLGTWGCDNNHRFDCAKEGYVNLLLAQQKNSKEPGDNKGMVLARQAFLASHAYLPLAQVLADIARTHLQLGALASPCVPQLLDIGCSQGYYSGLIQHMLLQFGLNLLVTGLDISKPAIVQAAKTYKQNRYAVASSFNIPLLSQSVDLALQVFAPSSSDEVLRVLAPKGMWLLVEPAPNHLHELKTFVYDQVKTHDLKQQLPLGFTLIKQSNLCFSLPLDSPIDRLNLLKMTPFYWRISQSNKERMLGDLRCVTADFTIKQLQAR